MNSNTINWLHITDLHTGQNGQTHLWPNFRAEFERDLKMLISTNGPIDLIFFTGDLVQSGERKQYEQLESSLIKLWDFFKTNNSNPKLVIVPGNHDLRRPDPTKSSVMALSGWHTQNQIAEVFWKESKSDIRKCITKCFDEYSRWIENTKIPILDRHKGQIPGDFTSKFSKGGTQIGIVGLNSTFLQINDTHKEKTLVISSRQLHSACPIDYAEWADSNHFNILLTHHPRSWLCASAAEELSREIAPPGRFRMHLCGHLHEETISLNSDSGATPILTHQGSSLFGLEYHGTAKTEKRQHGYLYGQWSTDGKKINEKLWPRLAVRKDDGALILGQNHGIHLKADGAISNNFDCNINIIAEQIKIEPKKTDHSDFLEPRQNEFAINKFPKFLYPNKKQVLHGILWVGAEGK
jgi:predicted MPP superfamily phosphohydrolase